MQLNRKESIGNAVGVKQYAVYEEKNMHSRPQMEDSTPILNSASFVHDCFMPNCPKSILAGVFDGHGGKEISGRLAITIPNVLLLSCQVLKNQIKACKGVITKAMELTFVEVKQQ